MQTCSRKQEFFFWNSFRIRKILGKYEKRSKQWRLNCFSFFSKKRRENNVDVSTSLSLVVASASAQTNERTDGTSEATTKRKVWPTSNGNREKKVCMYSAVREAIGWERENNEEDEREREKKIFLLRRVRASAEKKEREKKKGEKNKKERQCTSGSSLDQSVSNDDAMLMNSSIVDDNFLCVLLSLLHNQRWANSPSLPLLFALL